MKKIIANLTLLLTLSLSAVSQNLNIRKLDSLFDALGNNNKIMGSFAVEKNGTVVYTRAIGYSAINADGKTKSTTGTLYRIGSITKMFTATMIFQLIEEGRITLSATLDQYFPQIPNSKNITIETLLKHRSGLFDFVNDQKDTAWITRPQSPEIIMEQIAGGEVKFAPDKKFAYSNSGYYLLARIIEKITGQTYNANLQSRICAKLHLNSTYSPADNELKENEANTFMFADNRWQTKTDIYFPNVVGVGDMLSTTTDLINFVDGLLDGKLTSQENLGLMKRFVDKNGYGMGLMKVPFHNKTGFGHAGSTYGTYTLVAKFPNDSLTIASFVNGQLFRYNDVAIGLLSICFNEEYEIPTFDDK